MSEPQTLFDGAHGRAVSRNTDPWTSEAAARSISSEQLTQRQAAVYELLRRIGPSTDEEWIERYRSERVEPMQSQSGLRTRRSELVERRLVVRTRDTRKLVSGRQAIVWAAVEL